MHSLINNQKIYGFHHTFRYVCIYACICSKFVEITLNEVFDARRISKFILVSNGKIH